MGWDRMEILCGLRQDRCMFTWLNTWLAGRPPPAHPCCGNRARERPEGGALNADPQRRIVAVMVRRPCTLCLACVTTCPQVFTCEDEQIRITPSAPEHFVAHHFDIQWAIDGCPEMAIAIRYADGTEIPAEA